MIWFIRLVHFDLGTTNRELDTINWCGGKGINTAMLLQFCLGQASCCLYRFLGSWAWQIMVGPIQCKDEMIRCLEQQGFNYTIDNSGVGYELNELGQSISAFKLRLLGQVSCHIWKVDQRFWRISEDFISDWSNKLGSTIGQIILDTSGAALESANSSALPDYIKPNDEELGELLWDCWQEDAVLHALQQWSSKTPQHISLSRFLEVLPPKWALMLLSTSVKFRNKGS